MEDVIIEELDFYCKTLDEKLNKPQHIYTQLTQSISNAITMLVFGSRFEYGSEQLANLAFGEYVSIHFKVMSIPVLQDKIKVRNL